MRRSLPYLVVWTLLAALGGFAWLTHHPETPWLERAGQWPVVGPWAARFREAYLGPPAVEGAGEGEVAQEAEEEPEVILVRRLPNGKTQVIRNATEEMAEQEAMTLFVQEPVGETVGEPTRRRPPSETAPAGKMAREPAAEAGVTGERGAPPARVTVPSRRVRPLLRTASAEPVPEPLDRLWLLPGTRLHQEPEAAAPVVASLPNLGYLPLFERRGEWTRVSYRGEAGWVRAGGGEEGGELPRAAKPKRILPVRPAELLRLRRARQILELDDPTGRVGPYRLFTDVEDPGLMEVLDGAAARMEEAYYARYGRAPGGKAQQAAVMFRREEDYRTYAAGDENIPGSGQQVGHAGSGVVAFFAGERSRTEVVRTFLHELTHLLNRRALAPRLPPWLEEGLAADLGTFWMEEAEGPVYPRLFGLEGFVIRGIDSSVMRVSQDLESGSLPSLGDLLLLDVEGFYAPQVISRNYAHSLLFVRYLLDGGEPGLADGFQAFLRDVAWGRPQTGGDFLEHLGRSGKALEAGFRRWVETQRLEITLRRM